ncbi:TSUP family transporter [Haloarcula nitratireducens]|uniref:Probable membrane transporter protein n=1 Tax=Haloarcula nitratireducens TaxID=2487749 RepID=A0AAW4PHN5_9EURY|nr:TSUP family transporter [Halomicroarcula nitratireducens]MBX0296780.1 TSUP family transporter [Halomicroarcula nitratireducens]
MLFPEFRPLILLLAVGSLLVAGIVKGTLGFGVGLISATLLLQLFPPKSTLMVLMFPIALSEIGLLVTTGMPWQLMHDHWLFFLCLVPGAVIGTFGLLVVPVPILYLALSGYIIVFLLSQQYESHTSQVAERREFGLMSGVATGVLGGGVGAAGPPAVPYLYLQTRDSPRAVFIGGMAAALVVPQLVRLPTLVVAGRFGLQKFILGSLAALIVLVGLAFGVRLRPHIPNDRFERLVQGLLLLMAGQLAIDAVV